MESTLEWLRQPPLGHTVSKGTPAQGGPQGESAPLGGWGESPEAPTHLALGRDGESLWI